MTAVDYIFEKLWDCPKDKLTWYSIFYKAKEMEKQQIIDCLNEFSDETLSDEFCDKYIDETYGNYNQPKEVNNVSFGEISDHAILTESTNRYTIEDEIEAFIQGAKWYREQLKQRQ